jgi:NADP-dependent 3-hydroxy acid dehydrogenase YdfG
MSNRSTAVVTGASAGVGRAVAIAFAQKGWNVALIARGKAGLEGARRDVKRLEVTLSYCHWMSRRLTRCLQRQIR